MEKPFIGSPRRFQDWEARLAPCSQVLAIRDKSLYPEVKLRYYYYRGCIESDQFFNAERS
jgi:hypothetical protein